MGTTYLDSSGLADFAVHNPVHHVDYTVEEAHTTHVDQSSIVHAGHTNKTKF